jgi:hypothetical protein
VYSYSEKKITARFDMSDRTIPLSVRTPVALVEVIRTFPYSICVSITNYAKAVSFNVIASLLFENHPSPFDATEGTILKAPLSKSEIIFTVKLKKNMASMDWKSLHGSTALLDLGRVLSFLIYT